MRNILSIILSFILLPCLAQSSPDTLAVHPNFKWEEVIMPISLIGAGTLGFIEPLKNTHYEVQDYLDSWRGDHRTTIDDFLQYVPLASLYGLSLVGIDAKHGYIDRTLELVTSYATVIVLVKGMKYAVRKPRPDGTSRNSFPSGHTAASFMGAELVRIEYADDAPWLAVGAYTLAATVGVLRVYNNRHWFTDVLAGAGFGILSARVGYWMLPYTRRIMHRFTGCDVFVSPSASTLGVSLNTVVKF